MFLVCGRQRHARKAWKMQGEKEGALRRMKLGPAGGHRSTSCGIVLLWTVVVVGAAAAVVVAGAGAVAAGAGVLHNMPPAVQT